MATEYKPGDQFGFFVPRDGWPSMEIDIEPLKDIDPLAANPLPALPASPAFWYHGKIYQLWFKVAYFYEGLAKLINGNITNYGINPPFTVGALSGTERNFSAPSASRWVSSAYIGEDFHVFYAAGDTHWRQITDWITINEYTKFYQNPLYTGGWRFYASDEDRFYWCWSPSPSQYWLCEYIVPGSGKINLLPSLTALSLFGFLGLLNSGSPLSRKRRL